MFSEIELLQSRLMQFMFQYTITVYMSSEIEEENQSKIQAKPTTVLYENYFV